MSCGCCIIGKTEKETLEKTLSWMSSWSTGIVKDLSIVRQCLLKICGGYERLHRNYKNVPVGELKTELDSIKTLICGLVSRINVAYKDDEDADLLENLACQFEDIKNQCDGYKPIPVDPCFMWNNPLAHVKNISEYDIVSIPGNYSYWQYRSYDKVFEEIDNIISKREGKKDKVCLIFNDKCTLEDVVCKENSINKKSVFTRLVEKYNGILFRPFYYEEKITEYNFEDTVKTTIDKVYEENNLPI